MKVIIFDFDGTLADTYPVVVAIVNRIGYLYGLPKIDPESNEYKGFGVRELIKRFKMPTWKLLLFAFHTKFLMGREVMQIKLFRGIAEQLTWLKANGYKLWIFSSNSQKNIKKVLGNNNCTSVFSGIVSEPSLVNKGVGLRKLMQANQIESHDTVYVGDEVRDFEGATEAGISFVGVSWGYNTKEALKNAGAKIIIDSPMKLAAEFVK